MERFAVQRSRELVEQIDNARYRVLRSMLGSATETARMLDAQRAAATGHDQLAASLTAGGRLLAAARERRAAQRWEQLAARMEARCSRPPAMVMRLLGRPSASAGASGWSGAMSARLESGPLEF